MTSLTTYQQAIDMPVRVVAALGLGYTLTRMVGKLNVGSEREIT